MRISRIAAALALVLVGCAAPRVETDDEIPPPLPATSSSELAPVSAGHLCVTSGALATLTDGSLKVDVGAMRGVVAGDRSRSAELAFAYPGPSAEVALLADGELRRQIGLKLRAQDSCNVVYVMWRIEPVPGIVVSVKHNPGQTRHDECGDSGYQTIMPSAGWAPAAIRPGETHTLRADLDGARLTVIADGHVAWNGDIPAEASSFDGPAGVRSDNGHFDFQLRTSGASRAGVTCSIGELASED